jgi:hypothetical protein
MMVILTLHDLLVLSFLRAGRIDWERESMLITSFKESSCLKRESLTSEDSSRRSWRNIGRICSLVDDFPIIGQRLRIFSVRAILTY